MRRKQRPSSSGSVSSSKRSTRHSITIANLCRGIFVRLIFFFHSLLYTWRVVAVSDNNLYWALLGIQVIVFIEVHVTLRRHDGEWKWFTPCIFLYLCNVIPCVWILEVESLDSRTFFIEEQGLQSCLPPDMNATTWLTFYDISIPVALTDEAWSLALQQILLFLLIAGRWILPRQLSHGKLSTLLLVNIGMAADIVEFLSEGNLEGANCDRMVTIMILAIWSISVLQFPFHGDGEELKRISIVSTIQRQKSFENNECFNRLFNFEVWSIFAVVFMQDGPFLGMRIYLIYLYGISDQSLVFFSAKNLLVLMLQFYRIMALVCLEIDDYGRTSLRFSKKMSNIRKTVRHLTGWGGRNGDEDDTDIATSKGQTEPQPECEVYDNKPSYEDDVVYDNRSSYDHNAVYGDNSGIHLQQWPPARDAYNEIYHGGSETVA